METHRIGKIAYICEGVEPGESRIAILYIHGAGLSKMLWNEVMSPCGNVSTIAVDLPGHGESSGKACRSIKEYADEILEFIGKLGQSRIIPCGLSMGGAVAIEILLREPGLFPAGILMNTGARLKVHPAVFDALKGDMASFLPILLAFALYQKPGIEKIAKQLESIITPDTAVAACDFIACDAFDRMESIENIDVPVLVISGAHDQITPVKYGEFLASRIPRSKHEILPETGHLSPIESPRLLSRVICRFLEENDFFCS